MGTQPGTHTWTWLDSVFQSHPPLDAKLSTDAWLNMMAAGSWTPGIGQQNRTAYNMQQYCNSIHAG
jgi:hypothetical protein